jgi:ABC-type transport system involved in multi-copper enzyme maturation permease subunit
MSRIRSWLTLSFRLHRWEVLASAAGTALLAIGMLWFASQLRALAATETGCPDPTAYVAGCEQFAQRFSDLAGWGRQLLLVSWGTPFGMGLVLGVPLVAREVEHRTAGMAWTLSRSRAVWLAQRVAFLALVVIGLLVVVAIVSDILASALVPTLKLDSDFTWYGRRGGVIVLRGLLSLGIGVVVGAAVGRLLPAMLVAAFASVLVFTALSLGMDRWLETDAVLSPAMNGGPFDQSGGRSLGMRIELANGEVVTWEQLLARGYTNWQEDMEGRLYTSADDVGHPENAIGWERQLLVPGPLYPQIVLRESAVAGAAGLVLLLAAAGVVGRRRPG